MKPELVSNPSGGFDLLLLPSHEEGFFLLEEPRGMRIIEHIGQSAVLKEVAPEDAVAITNYKNDALGKYVKTSDSEEGVYYSPRLGHEFQLFQNRDGSGFVMGGDGRVLREFAPYPPKYNPLLGPMGSDHLDL